MTTIDTTPVPAPTPIPAPRIDPRLRQRWIDARREEGRRRLRLFVATLAVVVLLAAAFGVLHTPLLKVRHVRVSLGVVPAGSGLTAAQILAQAGLNRERLMVDVSAGAEARLVEALPWVATARVERDWPGTIRIAVTERHAVAEVDRVSGQAASGFAVLDATGRVLAVLPARSSPAPSRSASGSGLPVLPRLEGLPAPGAAGTSMLGSAESGGQVAALELATAAALPAALVRRVSTITITANGLQLSLGSVMVLFGDASELAQKVTSLETVLSDVSLAGVHIIDLRVPDRPALTRSQPTASVSTTAGG